MGGYSGTLDSADTAESRLALTELLLASQDLGECAQKSVQWLADHAGVGQALCLSLVADDRLFTVAGHGVSASRAGGFEIRLSDDNALAEVALGERPVYFAHGRKQPPTPLERTGFHAIPLRSGQADTVGLLLTSAPSDNLLPEITWVASVLGHKLAVLRSRQIQEEDKGKAETTLTEERALLYSLVEAVTDPILLTDDGGKIIISNSRAERLFTAPEGASEGWRRAVALNSMLFSAALTSRALGSAETRSELLLVDPTDGSDLLFELLSTPLEQPESSTKGIVSVLHNVTDLRRAINELRDNVRKLKAAEGEVRAERHRLDLVIDSVADPIVVTAPAGDIILMNPPAERLFAPGEGSTEDSRRGVLSNDARFSTFVSSVLVSGLPLSERHRGEFALVDPATGREVPFEAIAGKIHSEQGELVAVVTILHDRTEAIEKAKLYEQLKKVSSDLERKVAEATGELVHQNELLRRQALELERASSAKSAFLANVSHELRTPLNAVLGYTAMLLEGVTGRVTDPQRRSLTRVDSNARHLLAIINDILDISRIEAGRMPIRVSEFALSDLIEEVLAELEPIVARSGLEVSVAAPPKLPRLRSDRQKVKQILLNLLSNALKFTQKGWVKLQVRHHRAGRKISIAVSDSGIGIAAENQSRIFEDFHQVDSSHSRQYTGTGLGLAICKRLSSMLRGDITLESEAGKGSTFTLRIPISIRK